MQFTVGSAPVFLHRVWSIWIDNDGKRGIGGKISQDGNRWQLRIAGARDFNRRAKRALRLRQSFKATTILEDIKRLEWNRHSLYRMSPTRAVAITCFW